MKIASIDEQYAKFPDVKREDVAKVLDWATKQPHLPQITELEAFIFLHSNYCKIEATKTTIDNYYTYRTHIPNFFDNRDILGDDMQMANEVFVISTQKKLNKDGSKLVIGKLRDTDPSKFSLNQMLKMFTFVADAWLMEEGSAEGQIICIDLQGVQLGHVARLGIMSIKHYINYVQDALPFRLKGLHFINIVPFVDKIVFLMKPFMNKELWDVFHLHSSMETFHKFVDPSILPSDYSGGEAPSYGKVHETFYKHLCELKPFFLEEEQTKRVNEKARPGKPTNVGELFGMEGNFKKLEFD